MYKESLDNLNTIDRKHLPGQLLTIYYLRYAHTYLNLCFYIRDEIYAQKYTQVFKAYRDTLLSVADKSSNEYAVAHLEVLIESGQYSEVERICLDRLDHLSQENHSYAMTAATLADTYHKTGNSYMQKKYLMLSAISDMKAAVREHSSLIVLASILYDEGDLQRANNYVERAMADANFYNARLRNIEIAKVQPVITNAYQEKIKKQTEELQKYIVLVSILSVFLFVALFYIYRQMRKLSRARKELSDKNIELNLSNADLQNANEQSHVLNKELNRMNLRLKELNQSLSEANFLKEEYIGHFLDLCSDYIEKLDNYRKSLNQKAAAGQWDDLIKSLKSSHFIDDELKNFYKYFDSSCLRIYPDFVSQFNDLLHEDERFELKKDGLLHTELRVFALIRLGIEDNAKIASFLRCSIQTVYNYKNKIKNKAIVPRDEFEKWVSKIGN
jgi:DNA-binding CsgD family transcriptional regulator/HAMP domain-containing protein